MDNPNIYVQRGTGAAYYQGYPVTQHANGRHYYTDSTTKQSRWVTRLHREKKGTITFEDHECHRNGTSSDHSEYYYYVDGKVTKWVPADDVKEFLDQEARSARPVTASNLSRTSTSGQFSVTSGTSSTKGNFEGYSGRDISFNSRAGDFSREFSGLSLDSTGAVIASPEHSSNSLKSPSSPIARSTASSTRAVAGERKEYTGYRTEAPSTAFGSVAGGSVVSHTQPYKSAPPAYGEHHYSSTRAQQPLQQYQAYPGPNPPYPAGNPHDPYYGAAELPSQPFTPYASESEASSHGGTFVGQRPLDHGSDISSVYNPSDPRRYNPHIPADYKNPHDQTGNKTGKWPFGRK